jgi:hypothetical protein
MAPYRGAHRWLGSTHEGCILVRVEYLYVQSLLLLVLLALNVCSRGYKQAREGQGPKSLGCVCTGE